jgi:hypothetical protein
MPPTTGPVTDNARLTFVHVNGEYRLEKFDNGKTYIFPSYKAEEDRSARNGQAQISAVVVATR